MLLGDPGSGKTTTLMAFARDAIARRLEDPQARLPLLAPVSTWDVYEEPEIAEWLSNSVPSLKDAIHKVIQAGDALVLLDGLDELGSARPIDPEHPGAETFDPRQKFIDKIPDQNQILLTCRFNDYRTIGAKVRLQGAVSLQPLDDAQIADYLRHQPDLQAILQRDRQLKDLVRTPLLLSLVAFGFADAAKDLSSLEGLGRGEVSDRIFDAYLRRRYEHERRKPFAELPYSYDKMIRVLQCVARTDATGESQNTLRHLYINQCLGYEPEEFIEQAIRLHILLPTIDPQVFQFIHLLLRDYFAYPALVRSLKHKDQWRRLKSAQALGELGDDRAVEALGELIVEDDDENVRSMAAVALGKIGSPDGVPALIEALRDNRARVRGAAAQALGDIGDGRAVMGLITLAQDGDKMIRLFAIEAISDNRDPRAVSVLLEALNNPNPAVSQAASSALSGIGAVAIPALLEGLQSKEVTLKQWAATTLGKMQAIEAVPGLTRLLADTTSISFIQRICDIAAEALLLIATPEAVAAVETWKRQ
ncbi:MAG TPA: HEAT repeat domain-containing protein [Aggregatilineales bacterium]|nr:HEAT repeat domain-containing protein [Aggregatilineales bacterium]